MTDRDPKDVRNPEAREETPDDERLVHQLAALPREVEPRRELWHGIEARIETQAGTQAGTQDEMQDDARVRTGAPWLGTRRTRWVWTAAALAAGLALVLVAAPSLRTWLDSSATGPSVQRAAEPPQERPEQPLEPLTRLAWQARQEDGAFVTRQALEMALGAARQTGRLPTEAATGLEAGLHDLDRAIGETHAALADDPANPQLRLRLAHHYRHEAALLQRVRSL